MIVNFLITLNIIPSLVPSQQRLLNPYFPKWLDIYSHHHTHQVNHNDSPYTLNCTAQTTKTYSATDMTYCCGLVLQKQLYFSRDSTTRRSCTTVLLHSLIPDKIWNHQNSIHLSLLPRDTSARQTAPNIRMPYFIWDFFTGPETSAKINCHFQFILTSIPWKLQHRTL